MKVYLAGSMSGGRQFEEGLRLIARDIQELGHKVVSPWVVEPGEDFAHRSHNPEKAAVIVERDLAAIADADAAVVEVSQPSHGVGYELRQLELLGKPVLCLKSDTLKDEMTSAMIEGIDSFDFRLYSEGNIAGILNDFFDEVRRGKEGGVVSKERQ